MVTILAGIIMFGILVFIHELGHFAVAKLAGVKVLKFSIGFGPRTFSKQWGETEYMVCAIPFGGYVQMLGEGARAEESVCEADRPYSFAEKSVGRRLAIVGAGPFMNLVLPFLLLPVAFWVGINLPAYLDQPACVGYVSPASPADAAGLVSGDCIVAVGGQPIASWSEADKALLAQTGEATVFDVKRAGKVASIIVISDESAKSLQTLGLTPRQEAMVGSLSAGMPAIQAGMEVGDRILAIDGTAVKSWNDMKVAIQQGQGSAQRFLVERRGQQVELVITPTRGEAGSDYLIGIAPHVATSFKRFGPAEGLRQGISRSVNLSKLTLGFIQKLVTGEVSTKNIRGPITVVKVAGQAAQTDLASILSILAFLSIQLGILNLLPIPVLDGGHLLFGLFELIFRRPLPLRMRELAQQAGLFLILLLMAFSFYNDILGIFTGAQ